MSTLNAFHRCLLAIGLCVALLVVTLTHRGNLQDAEHEVVFALNATMWKVSELVFEAQRFSTVTSDQMATDNQMEALQLRFDILWSRIDVVAGLEFQRDPQIYGPLAELMRWRTDWDPVVYGSTPIEASQLLRMREELEEIVVRFRRAWVSEFSDANFGTWAGVASSTKAAIARQEWLIGGLLAAMIGYLALELFFTSKAKRREQALRAAADAANRVKSDFIANVSHEIRTPLNGIVSMATHLSDHALTKEQSECVAVIQDSGDLLLSTINDVLDLSKIEAGQMRIDQQVFDPMRGLQLARSLYADIARDKGVSLDLELPFGPLPKLEGDERRIRQVLNNLVSNAIKFTDEGRVGIRAWYGEADETPPAGTERTGFHIAVTDTGRGIPHHMQEQIFEAFFQDADVLRRGIAGTGLGLPISRSLCAAMGGTLTVESEPGAGAVFRVFVPFPRVETVQPLFKSEICDPQPPQIAKARVLIVDDNATNRFVLRKLLGKSVGELLEADGGRAALDLLATERVDAVLMDVQMPGMDGLETTRLFQEAERLAGRSPPPVIGVTANVMPDQVARYKRNGMVSIVAKPVSKKTILAVLSALLVPPSEAPIQAQASG